MGIPLNVLIVEDSEDDALLLVRRMRDGGLEPTFERVDTAEDMSTALDEQEWDIVITDYMMPRFSGEAALKLLKSKGLDLPSIVVSGKIGEETAVEAMKAGAHDYIMKNHLGRLASTIKRELRESEVQRERMRTEKELEQLRRLHELILNSAGEGIIGLDPERRTTFVNPAAAAMTMWRAEDLIGQPVHKIMENMKPDESVNPKEECPIHTAIRDGVVHHALDEVFWRKDGTSFPVECVSTPIRDEWGELVGVVVTFKDITERKRTEAKLRRANEELQQHIEYIEKAQEQLVQSEKLAALGQLTAGFSHEVLSPINTISMNLQMMIRDPDTPLAIVKRLHDLEGEVDRITKVSQNFLHSSRQRPPERREIDVNEIVNRTLGLLEYELRIKKITVGLNLSEDLPLILADQDQLQQVVLNLLTNSRDAMPDGGRLVLSTYSVHNDGKHFVVLRVEDTGEGIGHEHLGKLFEPFFTTKAEGEGTGLGLSICQDIVEAHGGSIWAENVPNGGAAFVVRLCLQ